MNARDIKPGVTLATTRCSGSRVKVRVIKETEPTWRTGRAWLVERCDTGRQLVRRSRQLESLDPPKNVKVRPKVSAPMPGTLCRGMHVMRPFSHARDRADAVGRKMVEAGKWSENMRRLYIKRVLQERIDARLVFVAVQTGRLHWTGAQAGAVAKATERGVRAWFAGGGLFAEATPNDHASWALAACAGVAK